MDRQVTATEAKASLLALLDDVATGDRIEITKHGHTVARLVPARGPRTLKASMRGRAATACEETELFSTGDAWNAS